VPPTAGVSAVVRTCGIDDLDSPYAGVEVTNQGTESVDVSVEVLFENPSGALVGITARASVFDLAPGGTTSVLAFGEEGAAGSAPGDSVTCTVGETALFRP
jgi:hypothetical protein